jgi:hypothetical protein
MRGREHSTIMSSCKLVTRRAHREPGFGLTLRAMERELAGRAGYEARIAGERGEKLAVA